MRDCNMNPSTAVQMRDSYSLMLDCCMNQSACVREQALLIVGISLLNDSEHLSV